jgi:uncharacterized membrane protein
MNSKPCVIFSPDQESALQAKLTRMALMIGYVGTAVAVVTVIALFIRYFTTVRKML